MAKKLRVYELAKHYGVDSNAIMKMMRDMHAEAKSHMSVVEDDIVDRIHSTFQRKRELMRLSYAESHKMDPEKLKHVASFRPLDRPQPAEEPEKPAKKAPAKKKTATKKKTTTKKTTKKAAAKPAADEPAAEVAAKPVAEKKKPAAKAAPAAEAPAPTPAEEAPTAPRGARIVRRAVVEAKEAEEAAQAAQEVEETTPAEELFPEDIEERSGEDAADEDAAETGDDSDDAPVTATEAAPADAKGKRKQPEPEPINKRPRRTARIIRMGEGVVQTEDGKAHQEDRPAQRSGGDQPTEEKWDWGEVRRNLTGGRGRGRVGSEVKDSVRESVQAAMQRRQEVKSAEPSSGRSKRRKKKKVDEAEVAASVKQTLAQMDGGKGKRKHRKGGGGDDEEAPSGNLLRMTEYITLQELAEKFEVSPRELIGKLFALGMLATMNQRLEKEQIEFLADEFEKEIEFLSEYGEEELAMPEVAAEDMEQRAPVVTVMGHVDHGKTSLLDYIRKSNVIAGEAGGITQHIGAYRVQTPGGPITFLDTPGHEAFSAMRARGAQVTDIVILIIAADDQVMPQTIEAINHAKAAGVPIIVAINKIDMPGSRPDLVKRGLLQHNVLIEEFGGDVLCAEISAKQGVGIEKLLDMIHLQSEVLELSASAQGHAHGVVVEASKEQGRGVLFTVLVEQGTLRVGDPFVCGMQDGRVRALLDERGEPLESVGPGEPAVVMGAGDVPVAGDRLHATETEREAREIAAKRRQLQRVQQFSAPKRTINLENLAEMVATGDVKELPIIVKADVSGSVEAICDALMGLNTEEVQVRILHKGVGAINDSDVLLASNTGAMIIGFHMRPGPGIRERAKEQGITIEVFDIIYEVVDTMKKAMAGLLGAITREVSTGSAQVRQVFTIPKLGTIAGSMVTDGVIIRNSLVRLVRDEVMIFEGKISSLKRFKEDVKEVQTGYECGIGLDHFHDLQEGDIVETFRIEEEIRTEL